MYQATRPVPESHPRPLTARHHEDDTAMPAPDHIDTTPDSIPDTETSSPDATYRYVDMSTGAELPADSVTWDEPELSEGAVLHTIAENGHKQHYTVHSMQGDEDVTVYLEVAKNRAWKIIVLAAILGACWYLIDFLIKYTL